MKVNTEFKPTTKARRRSKLRPRNLRKKLGKRSPWKKMKKKKRGQGKIRWRVQFAKALLIWPTREAYKAFSECFLWLFVYGATLQWKIWSLSNACVVRKMKKRALAQASIRLFFLYIILWFYMPHWPIPKNGNHGVGFSVFINQIYPNFEHPLTPAVGQGERCVHPH